MFTSSGFGGRFGGYTVHYHMIWISNSSDQVYIFDDSKIDEKVTEAMGTWTGSVIQTNSSSF